MLFNGTFNNLSCFISEVPKDNISVTLVSESYVILYCEKKCNM
jgi:hypothetical protein